MVVIGNYCVKRGIVCENATPNGYCKITVCVRDGYSTTTTCSWSVKVPKGE